MFERIRATAVGALLGFTMYVGWLTTFPSRLGEPQNWALSGNIKWFVLAGAFFGLVGGLSLAESWLERERGELVENTILNALFVVAVVVFGAVFILAPRA